LQTAEIFALAVSVPLVLTGGFQDITIPTNLYIYDLCRLSMGGALHATTTVKKIIPAANQTLCCSGGISHGTYPNTRLISKNIARLK
jgi:hypothetical protein